jgi:hypothetical protein
MRKVISALILISVFSYYTSGITQFYFENFSSTDELNYIGNASQINDTLCLNPSVAYQTSAVWHKTKQIINQDFEVSFQFQIDQLTPYGAYLGADGFAFVIQNNSDISIGGGGGEMGYDGIPNSIAFEFDTWDNNITGQTNYQDPNDNHISINTNGTGANSVEHRYSLDIVSDLPDFSDGQMHEIFIRYQDDSLNLFFDSIKSPVLSAKISIKDTLSLDEGKAWVGFTSSAGAATERHSIISWSFNKHLLAIETDDAERTWNDFRLNQNYPNPFNPSTKIQFHIPKSKFTTLRIYNIQGKEVATLVSKPLNQGNHIYTFDGRNLASGIYYYQLVAGDYKEVKKMILLR